MPTRKKSCIGWNLYTLPSQLTPPGTLTAHRRFFLWLLHSCPDQIRRFLLRETHTSSPLTKGGYISSILYRIFISPILKNTLLVYKDFKALSTLRPSYFLSFYSDSSNIFFSSFAFLAAFSSLFLIRSSLKKSCNI